MKQKRTRSPPFGRRSLPTYQERLRGASGLPRYDDEAHPPRARRLAQLGLTDFEIADFFGVSESTLKRWSHDHPDTFGEALRDGRLEADAKMAEALFTRGIGYERDAVKIFQGTAETGPVYAPYKEHIPGDVGAQRYWLNNRQPHLWKEKQEVVNVGSIEARLRALSPEQRMHRLLELQEKIDANIAYQKALEAEFTEVATGEESGEENST